MWGKYSFLWLQKHLQTWVCSLKICCFLLLCVGQAACLSLCGYLPVPVCVCGIVLGGITFEVLFALLWPPKWKSFDAPFLITPPSITNIHTHTQAGSRDDLPVPLQCHSASNFSFIQTQTAFPSSVFNPRERHGGGGIKREEIRKMLASHNLSRFITLSSKVQISYMCKLVKLQVAVSLSFWVKAWEKTAANKTGKLSLLQEKKES